MSHILKSQNDLLIFSDIINQVSKDKLNKEYLEEILKLLIPNNNGKPLIDYNISERNFSTAIFIPRSKRILLSLEKILKWLEANTKDIADLYKINDTDMLKSFLFLFVITHEIEHSYQYLIGEGLIPSPSKTIQCGYKGIFDLLVPDNYIIPRPIKQTRKTIATILYKLHQNSYVLERNANVESTDLLCQLAEFMEREDLFKVFDSMKREFICLGYYDSPIGCLEETYKKLLLHDKYKKFFEEINIPEDEKIRYGLGISDETRQKILRKK